MGFNSGFKGLNFETAERSPRTWNGKWTLCHWNIPQYLSFTLLQLNTIKRRVWKRVGRKRHEFYF